MPSNAPGHPPYILGWGCEACGLGPSPGSYCVPVAGCCWVGAWKQQQQATYPLRYVLGH